MSSNKFDLIFKKNFNQDSTSKLIMLALYFYSDKNNMCSIPAKKLADLCSTTATTIHRKIKLLATNGFIEIKHQFADDGGQLPNIYKILWDK